MTQSILFFADRLPPLIGGMEMHARYFIEHFSDHVTFPLLGIITKSSVSTDILISKNNRQAIDIEKLPQLFNPKILFFNSGRWIEVLPKLRQLFPTALFIYRTGGNEILKAPLEDQSISNHSLRQAYWVSNLNLVIDLLITNSSFTEARLREIGITCAFTRCVGGVNTAMLKPTAIVSNKNIPQLFCAARFVHYKNHHLLISVFQQLILRGNAVHLRLAGDGPLLAEIKERVKTYKLESAITFLGAVDNETVCQEIVNADVYIQLSADYLTEVSGGKYVHSEGMGRSILEAISAGTFIIAGNSGALSEIITSDKGLLLELNNPAVITAKIEQILKQLPIKLPTTEAYSWKQVFDRYEKFMKQVK